MREEKGVWIEFGGRLLTRGDKMGQYSSASVRKIDLDGLVCSNL